MRTFVEHLARERSICGARRSFIRERRWSAEDWYRAWQDTPLAGEVTAAVNAHSISAQAPA